MRSPSVAFWPLLIVPLAGCGGVEHDPRTDVKFGDLARATLLNWAGAGRTEREAIGKLPDSASSFYSWEGGDAKKSIIYASFQCASRADCEQALEHLSGARVAQFSPFAPSRYATVMEGPALYDNRLQTAAWDLKSIGEGLMRELETDGGALLFYAADLKRNRVYFHYSGGGFRRDPYQPGR